jgi:hypothetical protein
MPTLQVPSFPFCEFRKRLLMSLVVKATTRTVANAVTAIEGAALVEKQDPTKPEDPSQLVAAISKSTASI